MNADLAAERTNMVDSQVRPQDVTDLAIQDAMRAIPREALVPAGKAWLAYADSEVEYAPGRWMLRPRDVAKLLQALRPRAGEAALAISAPYACRVLTWMGLSVTERDAADPNAAAGAWPLIVCEGAVCRTPEPWLGALAPGGRLGLVERKGPLGRAVLHMRTIEAVGTLALFDCTPPMMAGFDCEPGFVF